mmetsp:Transcript_73314/g.122437  ORF Transcript_73314/g.122437 Transcript_73314/m.122437 type:complete len:290 (+) Transcript_73314:110-979(+)|eukprot:CAMPEP_0119314298 /NCGR_PEP_ID=MMETSP1333-20130426/32335_1 /TAXON_ID=418940 /ORGANISM="Scyphosphaera apsteinii, Strain RCC1455" /LENGTH=289 /DNA_ID=CAMNT_0007319379 /DNA_START=106 /DNA_END=975 /DNA_ORIENTATION=-
MKHSSDSVARRVGTTAAKRASPCSPKTLSHSHKIAKSTVSFAALIDDTVPPHTLILGTHPSEVSFAKTQYFGNSANAFWWIVGDALGFRRDAGLKTTGEPAGRRDYFAALRYEKPLLNYESGLALFTSRGFALWDVVGSCSRVGSLDSDIHFDSVMPNDVRGLCALYPTIRRICLGSGQESAKLFLKHHGEWLASGAFHLPQGQDVPPPFTATKWQKMLAGEDGHGKLSLVVLPSVSPAAAGITYVAKREAWECWCYTPGLRDYEAWQKRSGRVASPYFALPTTSTFPT